MVKQEVRVTRTDGKYNRRIAIGDGEVEIVYDNDHNISSVKRIRGVVSKDNLLRVFQSGKAAEPVIINNSVSNPVIVSMPIASTDLQKALETIYFLHTTDGGGGVAQLVGLAGDNLAYRWLIRGFNVALNNPNAAAELVWLWDMVQQNTLGCDGVFRNSILASYQIPPLTVLRDNWLAPTPNGYVEALGAQPLAVCNPILRLDTTVAVNIGMDITVFYSILAR